MSVMASTENVRRLIQKARDAHGWTYEDIADRSDPKLGRSLVHKIATARQRDGLLPPEQIRGLAHALGVPTRVVRDAALADVGLLETSTRADLQAVEVPSANADGVRLIAQAYASLSPSEQRTLEQMAQVLLQTHRDGGGGDISD